MDRMPSLIVKLNEAVVKQLSVPQGDFSIGRRRTHGLVLEDAAVSADHANIFTVGQDSFLKDLDSTNGTYINNRRTRKHHLKHGDQIVIGKYTLIFGEDEGHPADESPDTPPSGAALFILSGPNSGKRIDLTATITHLGKSGRSTALITRKGERYTLMADLEPGPVLCNGKAVLAGGRILESGDLLELGETRLQFYCR